MGSRAFRDETGDTIIKNADVGPFMPKLDVSAGTINTSSANGIYDESKMSNAAATLKRPFGAISGYTSAPSTKSDTSSDDDSDRSTDSSEYKSGEYLCYKYGDSSASDNGCRRVKDMSPGVVCSDCRWYNPRGTDPPVRLEYGRYIPDAGTAPFCTSPLYLP